MAEQPRKPRRKRGESGHPPPATDDVSSKEAVAAQPSLSPDDARAAAVRTLTAQAEDPDKVKAALVDAANMARNIWITFISFGAYLVIAVGAVTHRQLFLEEPIKLPLLNVDLPLVGFFVVAPLLFLIFHLYLLLHLKLMADKVRLYSELIRGLGLDRTVEDRVRLQLPNFVFVQFLAGPREDWKNLTDLLLMAIAWITVVIGPLILLLLIQLQFLPYHLERVTWVQRAMIILDLGLLWWFWPDILRGIGIGHWPALVARAVAVAVGVLVVAFSTLIATFPGETVHGNPLSRTVALTNYFFEGAVDGVRRRPTSWFSNRLVLPDQRFVDAEVLDRIIARQEKEGKRPRESERTLSLRGRDLRGAVLVQANLRRVDLGGAQLQGASLAFADLQGASLAFANLQGASFARARLQGAVLVNTQLQRASFDGADLQGASLGGAQADGASLNRAQPQGVSLVDASLQGTSLFGAQLQGARLTRAQLQGSSLSNANMQGTSLENAQLQGASLFRAQLQAALLDRIQLQGATLDSAELQGASLEDAQLQGASLEFAQMQGASLKNAQLQGAFLDGAKLQSSDLTRSVVWRTMFRTISLEKARLDHISYRSVHYPYSGGRYAMPIDRDYHAQLLGQVLPHVADGVRRKQIRERLGTLLPDHPEWSQERDNEISAVWQRSAASPIVEQDGQRALASTLIELGCAKKGAPYVARGLIRNGRIRAAGEYAVTIEKKFVEPESCPGGGGLTEDDKLILGAIVRDIQLWGNIANERAK